MPSSGNSGLSAFPISMSWPSTVRTSVDSVIAGLADHVGRVLVAPQAQETRVTELAVVGPLGETELADVLRFDPGRARFRRRLGERAVVGLDLVQPLAEAGQEFIVVAGPDL